MTQRSHDQRQNIVSKYNSQDQHEKSLQEMLQTRLIGPFRDILLMLCDPFAYAAKCINTIFLSKNMRFKMFLIHIFRSYTMAQMKRIKNTYKTLYSTEIEENINKLPLESSYKDQLRDALNADRHNLTTIDWPAALKGAKGLANCNNDNATVVFCSVHSGPYCQERATLYLYNKLEIRNRLSWFTGDDELAHFLHNALTDLQNLDFMLIHAIVSHCEVDMVQVKEHFEKCYGKSLIDTIWEKTQGNFRDVLLILCGEHPPRYK